MHGSRPGTQFLLRNKWGVLFSALIFALPQLTWAQCVKYAVDVIPGPHCQFTFSQSSATGISETGELCGGYSTCGGSGAGVWLGQGWWAPLPLPPSVQWIAPQDINSSRQLAAFIPDMVNPQAYRRAAFYDYANSTMINLGVLPGGNTSESHAINEAGTVCGLSTNTVVGPLRAFLWHDGQMTALNLPMGPNSEAYDIADTGAVCGWMGIEPHTSAHAFIWLDGKTTDLGIVERSLGAEARGISSNGLVVTGRVIFPDPNPELVYQKRAFIWHDGRSQDLGALASTHNECIGYDVNDSKIVVGRSTNHNGVGPAFVWRNGVMTALNDLIPPGLSLDISRVSAINNVGQIVGTATMLEKDGGFDGFVAYRLTPIQPPLGDCDCNGNVGIQDLLNAISQWGPAIPTTTADFDNNGVVNVNDLLIVIANWG